MAPYFRIGLLQILNILAFAAVIIVNGLADFLPINGQTTGEISNRYPNLFVPAPVTFAIWAIIYSFLFLFCFYQGSSLFEYEKKFIDKKEKVVARIGYRFVLSCILNISWILAWHYNQLLLSVLIMLGLLSTLISIFQKIHSEGIYGNKKARWFVYAPFSIYLGWISIATIANITAYLVSIGWTGWNVEEWIWTVIMVIAGTILGVAMLLRRNNVFYAVTVVWALAGIILKQRSASGTLNTIAITALCASILLLLLAAFKLRTLHPVKETVGNKQVN
ncbi:MAG TPA: hypothetical protein VGD17_17780 [Chitinophagaceae bacterium]